MANYTGSEGLLLALLLDKISLHQDHHHHHTSSSPDPAVTPSPSLTTPPVLQNPKTSSWSQPSAVLPPTDSICRPPASLNIGHCIKSEAAVPPSLHDSGYFSVANAADHDDSDNDPTFTEDSYSTHEPWVLVYKNGSEDQSYDLEFRSGDFDGDDQWDTLDRIPDLASTSRSTWLKPDALASSTQSTKSSSDDCLQFVGAQFDAPAVFERKHFDGLTIDLTIKGLSVVSHLHSLLKHADHLRKIRGQCLDASLQDRVPFNLTQTLKHKASMIRHSIKQLLDLMNAVVFAIPSQRLPLLGRSLIPSSKTEYTVSQPESSSLAGSSSQTSSTGPTSTTGSSGSAKQGVVYRFQGILFKRTSQGRDSDGERDEQGERNQRNDRDPCSRNCKPKPPISRPHAWACPYHKLDPDHFGVGQYKPCKKRFSQWNAVRQHLRRVHYEGKQSCHRCLKEIRDDKDRQAHTEKADCTVRKIELWERYVRRGSPRSKKLRKLTNIRRAKNSATENKTDELCWKRVWDNLFPDRYGKYPEPIYHEAESTEDLSSTSQDDAIQNQTFPSGSRTSSRSVMEAQDSFGAEAPAQVPNYPLPGSVTPPLGNGNVIDNQTQRQRIMASTQRNSTESASHQSNFTFQPDQSLLNSHMLSQEHANSLEAGEMSLIDSNFEIFGLNLQDPQSDFGRLFAGSDDPNSSLYGATGSVGEASNFAAADSGPSSWILSQFVPMQRPPQPRNYHQHHGLNQRQPQQQTTHWHQHPHHPQQQQPQPSSQLHWYQQPPQQQQQQHGRLFENWPQQQQQQQQQGPYNP